MLADCSYHGCDVHASMYKNPTIFNMIRWVDGTIVSSTKCLMFQVGFFSQFLSKIFAKILLIFFHNFRKKIRSFE